MNPQPSRLLSMKAYLSIPARSRTVCAPIEKLHRVYISSLASEDCVNSRLLQQIWPYGLIDVVATKGDAIVKGLYSVFFLSPETCTLVVALTKSIQFNGTTANHSSSPYPLSPFPPPNSLPSLWSPIRHHQRHKASQFILTESLRHSQQTRPTE